MSISRNPIGDAVREGQTHRRLARNSIFSSFSWASTVILQLLIMPVFIRCFGIEVYGVYLLLSSLFGYYALLDFGFGVAVTKFVAQFAGLQDQKGMTNAINAALLVQCLAALTGVSLIFIFDVNILRLLNIPEFVFLETLRALHLSAAGFMLTMMMGTFSSVLAGLQRYDVLARASLFFAFLTAIVTVIVLMAGGGLVMMVAVNVALSAVNLGYFLYLVHKQLPTYRVSLRVGANTFREVSRFSGFVFLFQLSVLLNSHFPRLVVAASWGPAGVTAFVVPLKLVNAVLGAFGSLVQVLLPFTSELAARGKVDEANKVFLKASAYFVILSVPIYVFLAVQSKEILTFWMGHAFTDQAWVPLSVLSIASWLYAWTMIPHHIATGLGYPRISATGMLGAAICIALLALILTPRFGIIGTSFAVLISNIIVSPIFNSYVVRRILCIPLRTYLVSTLWRSVLPIGTYALISLILMVVIGFSSITSVYIKLGLGGMGLFVYYYLLNSMRLFPFSKVLNAIRS